MILLVVELPIFVVPAPAASASPRPAIVIAAVPASVLIFKEN